ncbi:heavy-metal-associated domain-containing protein [Thermosynechococcus sp. JY1334]|uniref:heavy-metal-associated domain-containing protein n=1 Tax=unclassified Thermosynechococcus TaxID=2622553 RepID=UPI002673D4DA|nr:MULTISPECIES: heavy-metal-associated domain-containing protein [unclassified Thermosynechococcus]MDR7898314.1 heavy-metal-associated domain-containing protein [Thermosynechococcus sp. JY1332]MDR7905715.1 heavy-metal-associated domain-containing protein [Thermosynechococcus sp. JY1334]WKT85452.1 heavy-metal-associated domain-containing protein [Thermosynechococcus sp. JY1339]WNC54398.1 heavy-metal-associated domain-containing protein [Thermosynechococcus sp. JY1331]
MVLKLRVPDMACGACRDAIIQAIQAVDTGATVSANLATKELAIETQAAAADIRSAIRQAGYTPQ